MAQRNKSNNNRSPRLVRPPEELQPKRLPSLELSTNVSYRMDQTRNSRTPFRAKTVINTNRTIFNSSVQSTQIDGNGTNRTRRPNPEALPLDFIKLNKKAIRNNLNGLGKDIREDLMSFGGSSKFFRMNR
jgi:hypothetical protein